MKKRIRVVVRRDAFVNYTTVVEGDGALTNEDAAKWAEAAWKSGDETVKFEEDGITEFDEIVVDPGDCEEVDEDGDPITPETPLAGYVLYNGRKLLVGVGTREQLQEYAGEANELFDVRPATPEEIALWRSQAGAMR